MKTDIAADPPVASRGTPWRHMFDIFVYHFFVIWKASGHNFSRLTRAPPLTLGLSGQLGGCCPFFCKCPTIIIKHVLIPTTLHINNNSICDQKGESFSFILL